MGCETMRTLTYYCWECKLVKTTMENCWKYLIKLNICLSYDVAILLLAIYTSQCQSVREMSKQVHQKTFVRTSIVVLFIIASN